MTHTSSISEPANRCQIKCEIAAQFTPFEYVVKFKTIDGMEEIAVSQTVADQNFLDAFYLHRENDNILVELPSESMSGKWRVWISMDEIKA